MRTLGSFKYAIRGIRYVFTHEVNFRIQCVLGLFVLIAAFLLGLRGYEKIILAMMIAFVLVLELLNTTIEMFLDLLKPRMNPQVAGVKDIIAGAVLIAALGSIVVGIIVFAPYIIELVAEKWYT